MTERPDSLGLKVLYEGSNPSVEYVSDRKLQKQAVITVVLLSIVAVHGLGATPDWAWVRKVKDDE